jgi:hypothetical protein
MDSGPEFELPPPEVPVPALALAPLVLLPELEHPASAAAHTAATAITLYTLT